MTAEQIKTVLNRYLAGPEESDNRIFARIDEVEVGNDEFPMTNDE